MQVSGLCVGLVLCMWFGAALLAAAWSVGAQIARWVGDAVAGAGLGLFADGHSLGKVAGWARGLVDAWAAGVASGLRALGALGALRGVGGAVSQVIGVVVSFGVCS